MKNLFFIFIFAVIFLSACQAENMQNDTNPQIEQHIVTQADFMMDTFVTIRIFCDANANTIENPEEYYGAVARQALDEIRRIEGLLSMTLENSDVWNINHSQGEAVLVSEHTIELLERAIHFREISGGAFDVTIGAVSELWTFGFETGEFPEPSAHAAALEAVGADIIIEGDSVRLSHPNAMIDLGGIGKGYAADIAASFLESLGVAAIVDIGGDTVMVGTKPDGTQWRVGIQDPRGGLWDVFASVDVDDVGFVTSGIYQRFFFHEGRRYHHVLNPQTGFPVDNDIVSVSIIAPDATTAEGIATAVHVLGAEAGIRLAEGIYGVEAVLILDDDGVVFTSGIGHDYDARIRLDIRR
ncbi:MAG: FAD:protein FMN transferase [Defluviitaleaceae bacterium]|nr:FAD:protein FMN transferase [Defluviitaleaceae bacterium]